MYKLLKRKPTGESTPVKILLMMKLITFLLIISMTQVSAVSLAQKITLSLKEASLTKVLSEIKEQSGYDFVFYSGVPRRNSTPISIHVKNEDINNVLKKVFEGQSLLYSIEDNVIIVKKASNKTETVIAPVIEKEQAIIQGTVTSLTGEKLSGVTIKLLKTSIGSTTGGDGTYTIKATTGQTLQFSFIGYEPKEVVVGSNTIINIQLSPVNAELDEVVVVGYGTVKKKDLTGAVSSVKPKDLPPAANTSVAHMLAGRAAGLSAVQQSAQPGGGVSLQIRGQSSNRSPLIVIDGFAQTGFEQPGGGYVGNMGQVETSLTSINPNDIESIEVLKDASATAIYGSRAAGGVILITTKRGKEGKVDINYKGSASIQKMYGLPAMLNPRDFMIQSNEAFKETWMRDNLVYPYGTKTLEQAIADAKASGKPIWTPRYTDEQINVPPAGTDWLSLISRTGTVQEHNLSVNGGTEKTRYMASAGYYDQKGVIQANNFKRFTTRFNLDQKFSKYISGGLTANISQVINKGLPLGTGANENSGIIRSAMQFNPLIEVRDATGKYNLDPQQGFLPNPVSLLEINDRSRTERLLMTSYVQVNPFEGFSIRGLLGVDRNQGKRNYYLPTTVIFGSREGGYASINNTEKTDYTVNLIANWTKEWTDHSLTVMGGTEYQKFNWDGSNAFNSQFPYDGVGWNNLEAGAREKPGVGSYGGSSEIASYISRVNYSFKNRYLMTANFRVDGSSNFAPNHRWGFFPGIALAWKINEENFMKGTSHWLSELKLRAGYGQTGNDNVSGIFTYYGTGWNYIFDGKRDNGIGLAALGNPNLKWETQTDINLGLDFGLWEQRISGTMEYFNRRVTDILGDRNLMSYQEVSVIKANLDAEKQSTGIEFSLRSNNVKSEKFSWTTEFNLTYYRDKWKKRDNDSWRPDIYQNYNAYFNEMWYYQSDGLVGVNDTEYIQKFGAIPGTIKIKDVNGYKLNPDGTRAVDADGKPLYAGAPDGKIDNADLVKLGVNTPVSLGLNNSFTFKNFDLNLYFYGMFNRWRVNDSRSYYSNESFRLRNGSNMYEEVKDRWSYANMESKNPSIFQTNAKYGTGDFYLEKAWFIRCRNITLGYTLPPEVGKKVFRNARFFFDVQNAFVITPYSGTDPETDQMAAYPNQRTFSFGIDFKF